MNDSARIAVGLFAFACLTHQSFSANFDWPQWRGPNRDGISKETGLLKSWPEGGPKRVWLFENAGQGYSGPAIVDGKLFTIGTREGSEILLALDANTGKEIWLATVGPIYSSGNDHGAGPRGTPTLDGALIYAMGGRGNLICANADGKILWQQSMSGLGGQTPGWGYTESVLVDGDQVLCTPGGSKGTVAALDKKTGQLLWQSKEITDTAHYSSIIPVELNGIRQYIKFTDRNVFGVAAKDGKLIWKSPKEGQTAIIPTPIYHDNHVYVTSGYGKGCMLVKVDANNQPSEVYKNTVMVNHTGGVVLIGDYIYGFTDTGGGNWICQNFKTSERVWASQSLSRGNNKGSITSADGMLYCLNETGTMALIDASPKGWQEHGRLTLDPQSKIRHSQGRIWTHPVVSNGKLYLRDQEYIYCFDVKG